MRIKIEFNSCWQTGFLGDDNKKKFDLNNAASFYLKGDFTGKLKKNYHSFSGYEQKFVATSGTRGEKPTPLSKSTLLGVLCRLIGDQRPLWQAKQSTNYYFSDIEDRILDPVLEQGRQEVDELVYLTNKSDDRCTQQGFLGVLDNDNPWFFSVESSLLWSVLYLDKKQLLDFIVGEKVCDLVIPTNACKPTELIKRVNILSDIKSEIGLVIKTKERQQQDQKIVVDKKYIAINNYDEKIALKPPITDRQKAKVKEKRTTLSEDLQQEKSRLYELTKSPKNDFESALNKAINYLSSKYPNNKKLGEEYCKNGITYPMSLYAAALYLQAERLVETGVNLPFIYNPKHEIQIQGFSKAGFNGVRDWLNKMGGGHKKSVGTPCYIKKHSGKLEIEINLTDKDKGREIPELTRYQEIKQLIETAGVSSFYLGKKGIAYITDIRP